ncbi:hypothetical protein HPB50_007660 [Hyalomma asiaticum]|uniref:Uncharacterized protein n=1 Tax=Hyalomma asiaticum TaxID=266040 RepID=A0ACB7TIQ9_HYAAI|nr:hypothetical protein HPB50_007660 [Hyalomma asiaticum]
MPEQTTTFVWFCFLERKETVTPNKQLCAADFRSLRLNGRLAEVCCARLSKRIHIGNVGNVK